MAKIIQVDGYTLSVPSPDSLNSTRVTYSVNNTSQTISLTNEALREKTTNVKREISQSQRQLDAAETRLNQAQTNLNQATAQVTQLVQQKPQFNRFTSYYEQNRLEQEYQKKLQLAQMAVATAKQSIEQARTTIAIQNVELTKQKAELSVLQDIASKFPSLQQTSVSTQLEMAQQQKSAQESTEALTQQAASTLKTRPPLIESAPIVGPTSDNYEEATSALTEEEIERLQASTRARLQTLEAKPITTINTTVETKQPDQVINIIENVSGQNSDVTKQANKNAEDSTSEDKRYMPFKAPNDNPLHQYVNYTYGISLFALSPEDYKTLSKKPKEFSFAASGTSSKRLLIASAGKQEAFGAKRSEYFEEDFYFDSLKIETVVGLNARARGTNAYDIAFTVVEPMGFTIFNRLLKTAQDLKIPNYLEMPFLMKIDFYGSTDIGQMMAPIPNQSKVIAIKLIECKTSISTRGTEYQFRAVPYQHQAFNETHATTPVNFSVTASKVGDFFDAALEGISSTATDADRQEEIAINTARSQGNTQEAARLQQIRDKKRFTVKSYTAGFNSWLRYLKTTGATQQLSEIAFVFDEKFINSEIVVPDKQKVENAPMSENTSNSVNPCADRTVTDAATFGINAGTDILKVIEMVMMNSKFVRDQIIDPKKDTPEEIEKKKNKPFVWYKVHAAVDLIEYDYGTNKWSKKITYSVQHYVEPNAKHTYGPSAEPNGVVKEYNYIYTGKNKDILDLKIDFDMTFYTAIMVARERMNELGNKAVEGDPEKSIDKGNPGNPNGVVQPLQVHPVAVNQKNIASGDVQKDSTGLIVADVVQNIYSTTRGDMINVQLKILGDPEFIKQDDLYLNPAAGFNFTYDSKFIGTNGDSQTGTYSLNFDSGAVLVKLIFRTPTDIDEQTGGLKMDGKFQTGVFSGVYRVVNVTSEFRQGKFEQVLNLIRLFNQETQLQLPKKETRETNYSNEGRSVASPSPAAAATPTTASTAVQGTQPTVQISDIQGA